MHIPNEKLEEFRKLYKEHFGKEISKEEALEKGLRLATLIKAIYKPIID